MYGARETYKGELMKWLRNLGLSVTGTKVELLTRIRKYQRYPNLIKKLKNTASPVASPVLIHSTQYPTINC